MDAETARERLLDAAATLFNERGVQAVGMDAIRGASGVSLKRAYQLFPSKTDLVEAVLRRRDLEVRSDIAALTATRESPAERVLALFDHLHHWFGQPDFRGCVFINSFGEMGGTSAGVADIARAHKEAVRDRLGELVTEAGGSSVLAAQIAMLADGAMVSAAMTGSAEPARQAKEAARVLLHSGALGG
ncbi:TetR/AcrR family transcriptional regulator [Streptomyces johnsoniae]|uniref:TetR/AcrR family transcriptional regulator n=1 Tax=Streptomyces johnsoniae TaxID=3075532 RepID=A0ABU2RYL7_9ACTN|nr:TetR/AcrR family transcriptional regulator [Streptomyces sp. DSM 41886]MDT0441823.1 TetR/AcrR family transcriptional regulator [Streptomyces sp. DSM 41886]